VPARLSTDRQEARAGRDKLFEVSFQIVLNPVRNFVSNRAKKVGVIDKIKLMNPVRN